MKIEDLKVGELYYDVLLGTIVLTSFYRNLGEVTSYHGENIGTFERLMGSREYPLYTKRIESSYFRLANDKEIEEALLESMTSFNVGNFSLSISEGDTYLTGNDQQICLKPDEVRKLMKILEKEVNV